MSQKKPSKKTGSVKLSPLRGRFFDIKPPKKGGKRPELRRKKQFRQFALAASVAFLALMIGNAIIQGRDLIFESEGLAYEGYQNIREGADYLLEKDTDKAYTSFSRAQDNFLDLKKTAGLFTGQNNELMSESYYLETANALLESALEVSDIGIRISLLMKDFSQIPRLFLTDSKGEDDLMEIVYEKKAEFDKIRESAGSLQQKLTRINIRVLPDELRSDIRTARQKTGLFVTALREVDLNFDSLRTLLGDQVPHRYLVLFQNNHEIRATGGFIGSYMILDVNDGRITKMETKDIYESDGQLAKFIEAPPGIDQVADQLFMRDANYSPDFPSSAKQIMTLLEASRGPSVDTVIAIDQTLVERLIGLVGPLRLESFPLQIYEDSFSRIVSFYTEAKLSATGTPKQLLFDLVPALKEKLIAFDDFEALFTLGMEMIAEGNIQIYSKDSGIQNLAEKFGIAGKMIKPDPNTDFLSVISTSIGGNKSDEFIEMLISHKTLVQDDGKMTDTVYIEKFHSFDKTDRANVQLLIDRYGTGKLTPESIRFIMGDGANKDYMRVYVPLGSELTASEGVGLEEIDVSVDLGYTVFGFIHGPIDVGETNSVTLTYNLPFELSVTNPDTYRFVAQNQAGRESVRLKKRIELPESAQVQESYPEANPFKLIPSFEGDFKEDVEFTAVIKLNK